MKEFLIEPKLFQATLARMGTEERGEYIMLTAIKMVACPENVNEPWVREKPAPRKTRAKKKKAYNTGYTWEFEEFWKCYPKKTAKGAAFAIWQDLEDEKSELLAACLKALTWQRESESWREGYIPKGENYLAGRCWEDEPTNSGPKQGAMGVAPSKTGRDMVL